MNDELENLSPITKDKKLIADINGLLSAYELGLVTESECANSIFTIVYEYAG
jgi:hypothetical protein